MERQLFDWTGWDGNHECMTFYNVVLKVPMDKFEAGTKFNHVFLIWKKGILQLPDIDNRGYVDINLKLSVENNLL